MASRAALGRAIKARRESAGLTQAELAERLGVHKMTVVKYEGGQIEVGSSRLGAIAEALGTTGSELSAEAERFRESDLELKLSLELAARGFRVKETQPISLPGGGKFRPDFLLQDPKTGERFFVEAKTSTTAAADPLVRLRAFSVFQETGIPFIVVSDQLPAGLVPPLTKEALEQLMPFKPSPRAVSERAIGWPPRWPNDTKTLAKVFEMEMIEQDATPAERGFLTAALYGASASQVIQQEATPEDPTGAFSLHLEALRIWLWARRAAEKNGNAVVLDFMYNVTSRLAHLASTPVSQKQRFEDVAMDQPENLPPPTRERGVKSDKGKDEKLSSAKYAPAATKKKA